jgi:hypothetical protein
MVGIDIVIPLQNNNTTPVIPAMTQTEILVAAAPMALRRALTAIAVRAVLLANSRIAAISVLRSGAEARGVNSPELTAGCDFGLVGKALVRVTGGVTTVSGFGLVGLDATSAESSSFPCMRASNRLM